MPIRIIALLVGVIVLSLGVSATFNINFIALFTGLFVLIKGFKVTFILKWLVRFLLVRLPQRLLTATVKLYIIDRSRMKQIIDWFTRKQQYWRTHYKLRLFLFGIIGLFITIFSAWWIGLWLLIIYKIEVLIEMVWRRIWPTLSETIFVKSISRCFGWLKNTRLGQFSLLIDTFLENYIRKKVEHVGKTHKETIKKMLEETLTYELKMQSLPPPSKEAGHRHLLEAAHCKKTKRTSIESNRRRHASRPKQ